MMKIYLLNGAKVWLDEDTAPAEAIPYKKPKAEKPAPVKITEPKAEPKEEPKAKAKAAPANKSRRAGGNK